MFDQPSSSHIRTRYNPVAMTIFNTHLPILVISLVFLLLPCTSACPVQCQCNSLYYVYCSQSAITDDVINDVVSRVSTSAKLLDLSKNDISRISPRLFGKLINLRTLNLAENRISELASNVFQNLTRLRELRLDNNRVASLDKTTFVGLENVKQLRLDQNLISSIGEQTFSKMASLHILELEKNSLKNLEAKTFSGMKKLNLLVLRKNFLTSIKNSTFSGLHSLQMLDLKENRLSKFFKNSFTGLSNLVNLDLSQNDISDMNFIHGQDFYLTLSKLKLSHNQISNIPDSILPYNRQLRTLDLCHNKIHRIANQAFKSLRLHSLNLSSNSLIEIDRYMFKDLPLVLTLDLSNNRINDIKTGAFDSFRERILELVVNDNALTIIHTGMFRGMASLRKLNFKNNRISSLDDGSFQDMISLEELNLSQNKLLYLSYNAVKGPVDLRHLDLTGNPVSEMSGFEFDDDSTNSQILVEVNSSVDSVSQTGASLSWPYRHGTQLYWTVSVHCLHNNQHLLSSNSINIINNNSNMKNSTFSSNKNNFVKSSSTGLCSPPRHPNSLKPFARKLILDDLQPGRDYFVCVNPMFLSPYTKMTQCAVVSTERLMSDKATLSQDRELSANSGNIVNLFRVIYPLCLSMLIFKHYLETFRTAIS